MRRFTSAIGIVLLLFLPSARAQIPAPLQAAIARIDAMAAAELAKDNVAGVTIGVVSGGELAWTKSYGPGSIAPPGPA